MDLNEELSQELKRKTLQFFKTNDINLPIAVKNSIEDVFDENDFNTDEDSVNIYFKEDLNDFLTDTMCMRKLNVQVTGGNSSGEILEKYTYYGALSTRESFSDDIGLYDGEELLNQLSLVEPSGLNSVDDANDYCIVVIEETEFHMGEYVVIPRLYMYCPISGANI